MKDFNDFLRTLTHDKLWDIIDAGTVKTDEAVRVEEPKDETERLGLRVLFNDVNIAICLLAEYHKWLHADSD